MGTDRKTSLLRDRPARRAVKRAYRIWVSDAAHHCVQLRNDLLFTMSDSLHRVIEDRRDTRFRCMDECSGMRIDRLDRPSLHAKPWWSQTGSNRRPPACKAGALPAELWPPLARRLSACHLRMCALKKGALNKVVGLGRLELPTSRLSSARSNQLSYKPPKPQGHATSQPKDRPASIPNG